MSSAEAMGCFCMTWGLVLFLAPDEPTWFTVSGGSFFLIAATVLWVLDYIKKRLEKKLAELEGRDA